MPELSNQGTKRVDAEAQTNTPGELTKILSFQPNDGLAMFIAAVVDGKVGVPVQLDLRDSNGDQLPRDTELVLEYDAPHLDKAVTVSETLANIATYRRLTLKEQQNEDYRDRTRIELSNGPYLKIGQNDEFCVSINCSEQIDWTNSRAYIDEAAVEVVSAGA